MRRAPDTGPALRVVTAARRTGPVRDVLVDAFGFGGNTAAIVLSGEVSDG